MDDDSRHRFLELLRPHWSRLYATAVQYAGTRDDAWDLVQETLLRAWRGFCTEPARRHSPGWLVVILRNVAIDWRRRAGRRLRMVPLEEVELTDPTAPDPAEPLASLPQVSEAEFRELLDDRLATAIDSLEGPAREVVVLSAVAGLTYREIAEALGCPVGTVMSRMARARRQLRFRLAEFYRQETRAEERRP